MNRIMHQLLADETNVSKADIGNAYARRLLSNFNALRNDSSLCDVEIVAGWSSNGNSNSNQSNQRIFYAHRTILAAASPYFNAMFTAGLAEAHNHQRIVLQSMSDSSLEGILSFVYSGDVSINRDNVQELMIAGDMIELQEVVQLCTKYLLKELEPSNAIGIFRFATDHNCMSLREASRTFIQENFVEVSKGEEFCDIPRELLVEFLASEKLRVDSEHQVFQAAMAWIESDLVSRRR